MEYIKQKIIAPDGYEIDKDKCTLEEIVFKKKQPERVRSFNDLGEISGWFIDSKYNRPLETGGNKATDIASRDIWPTKELAEAARQLSQLMQIRKQWIKDWEPDWNDGQKSKHCIYIEGLYILCSIFYTSYLVLSFPTKEMAKDFLETFKSELEIAKPLL